MAGLGLIAENFGSRGLPAAQRETPRPLAEAPWNGDLAKVIEGEIIPRLMLAHRDPSRIAPAISCKPSADQIERFTQLVLAQSSDDVAPHVSALIDSGLSVESLLLDLLAPTARYLGTLWERDECDFMDVTIAIARLQSIMNELGRRFDRDTYAAPSARRVLLMPTPGESHMLGLSMVAKFFRDAGWDVASSGGHLDVDPVAWVTEQSFDVVGLSLYCDVHIDTLAETIGKLRKASRNPSVCVMVGGPTFDGRPDRVAYVGADLTAVDARSAPGAAESVLDLRARA